MFNDKNNVFYCGLLRVLLSACVIVQVIFFLAAWSGVLPDGAFMQIHADGISAQQMRALAPPQRVAGAMLALPALLTLCYGMLRLARLLDCVRRGAAFERATIGHLRAFAGFTLLSTLLAIIEPPLRTFVLYRVFAGLPARYAIGFSSSELMLVLVCSLFFLVTNLLHEGRRLAEENEGFV